MYTSGMKKQQDSVSPDEIRALRQRLGLTQEAFAQRLCVASMTVSRWERGIRRPERWNEHLLRRLMQEERIEQAKKGVSDG